MSTRCDECNNQLGLDKFEYKNTFFCMNCKRVCEQCQKYGFLNNPEEVPDLEEEDED